MKRCRLLLLLVFLGSSAISQIQQLKIVQFNVKSQLPSIADSWKTQPSLLSLTVQKLPQKKLDAVKLVLQIRSENVVIAGNSLQTALLSNFTTSQTLTATELVAALGETEPLKKGNYTICAKFYNNDNVSVSTEACRSFVVTEEPKETEETKVIATGPEEEITAKSSVPPNVIIDPNITPNCTACSGVKITIPVTSTIIFYSNNSFTLGQNITIASTPAKLIRSIKADLVYFEYIPEDEKCMPCNKNSATFGNFNSGTIATVAAVGNGTHSLISTFVPAKPLGVHPVSLNISMPPTVNCCTGVLKFCIRYTVMFDDCTVCNQTMCYEKKKSGDPVVVDPATNPN